MVILYGRILRLIHAGLPCIFRYSLILSDYLALLLFLQAIEVDVATIGTDDDQALAKLIKLDPTNLVTSCERLVNRKDCVFLCCGIKGIVVYMHSLIRVILAEISKHQRIRKPLVNC